LKINVGEVMRKGDSIPNVFVGTPAIQAVAVLNSKNLGAVLIVDMHNTLLGIITDGDVRRAVAEGTDLTGVQVDHFMTENPVAIDGRIQAVDALSIMQQHEITILPIVGDNKELLGILHLHDLLGKGEFRFLV
jgi:arabinose-5-phosphate isomerase